VATDDLSLELRGKVVSIRSSSLLTSCWLVKELWHQPVSPDGFYTVSSTYFGICTKLDASA